MKRRAAMLIELKQEPIIAYDKISEIGLEVKQKIKELNIDTLEVTEANLFIVKNMRASLTKELKVFEDQRKFIKDQVMKSYNEFNGNYKKDIATAYEEADKVLKDKIDAVESALLIKKTEELKKYFEEVNEYSFITFDDLHLKIIRSTSNSEYFKQIDSYLLTVDNEIKTISTLENSKRILAKYQLTKDLNRAISEVNIEVKREKELEKVNYAEVKPQALSNGKELQKNAGEAVQDIEKDEDTEIFTATFTVSATKANLIKLRDFMRDNNIIHKAG